MVVSYDKDRFVIFLKRFYYNTLLGFVTYYTKENAIFVFIIIEI